MTDVLADELATASPVDVSDAEVEATLNPETDDRGDIEGDEAEGQDPDDEADDGLVDYEGSDGKTYRVPAEVKDGLMIKAEFTRKTQEMAEIRRAVAARDEAIQLTAQRQAEFAQDIAQLGALNARLAPYAQVQDWPSYIRMGGAEAQAQFVEYQALANERDRFAHSLGDRVQQRSFDEQREIAGQVEAGRAELAKHIKGYSPKTLDELVTFAAPFGFSPDEIRQAEADPRSIRILHLAKIGEQLLSQRKRTDVLAQGQKTRPAPSLRGAGSAPTDPRRMGPAEMAKHLGY
jgi:hypothetical protein